MNEVVSATGLVIALTGAGISAESGIPTFRGKEGYWTVGSRVYHPQDMATRAAFRRMPESVWQWYLYRRTVCRRAEPNDGHKALVTLEEALGDRFRLITQNVDGLHLRAGSSAERTHEIHGNIDFMRCASECTTEVEPIPDAIGDIDRDHPVDPKLMALIRCSQCGGPARPHVLWFDECYDEPHFRFDSSLEAASQAALVITVGSSGVTNLPNQVVHLAARNGAALIDINPEENPFAELATALPRSRWLKGSAATELPPLIEEITEAIG